MRLPHGRGDVRPLCRSFVEAPARPRPHATPPQVRWSLPQDVGEGSAARGKAGPRGRAGARGRHGDDGSAAGVLPRVGPLPASDAGCGPWREPSAGRSR
jgi:hypothetical protein